MAKSAFELLICISGVSYSTTKRRVFSPPVCSPTEHPLDPGPVEETRRLILIDRFTQIYPIFLTHLTSATHLFDLDLQIIISVASKQRQGVSFGFASWELMRTGRSLDDLGQSEAALLHLEVMDESALVPEKLGTGICAPRAFLEDWTTVHKVDVREPDVQIEDVRDSALQATSPFALFTTIEHSDEPLGYLRRPAHKIEIFQFESEAQAGG